MADINPLENLRDLHLPPAVSAWPPGPGYYVLLALIIVLLLVLIQHKRYKHKTAPRREALAELERIKANQINTSPSETAAAITHVLKRVALVYYPRLDVAQLHGEAWLLFLQKTSRNIEFLAIQTSLLETPFNPSATEDLTPLFEAATHWIKQRRKQCSN